VDIPYLFDSPDYLLSLVCIAVIGYIMVRMPLGRAQRAS